MKTIKYAAAALAASIAACSASGSLDREGLNEPTADGGMVDAGPAEDAPSDASSDGERPLVCGDAGFCETRLPKSDLGLPLSLQSVWVVASGDVWSVTAEGFVLHFDGAAWNVEYRAHHALSTVWATASSVWVGGESGLLLRRTADGAWTHVETWRVETIRSISGRGDDDVWVASLGDSIDHFDGSTLSAYPLGIPGIRVTTVFGRPGHGMYAAGYVSGTPATPDEPLQHLQPYVVELSGTGATVFSSALPEQRGFIPVAADVMESPEGDPTVFLLGFNYYSTYLDVQYGTVKATTPIALRGLYRPNPEHQPVYRFDNVDPDSPQVFASVWVKGWNDVLIVDSVPDYASYLMRWDGDAQVGSSLLMGATFPPRAAFGLHGNATEAWLVGDGFALKGVTP